MPEPTVVIGVCAQIANYFDSLRIKAFVFNGKMSEMAILRQPRANRVLRQLLALQLQAERIDTVRNDPSQQV